MPPNIWEASALNTMAPNHICADNARSLGHGPQFLISTEGSAMRNNRTNPSGAKELSIEAGNSIFPPNTLTKQISELVGGAENRGQISRRFKVETRFGSVRDAPAFSVYSNKVSAESTRSTRAGANSIKRDALERPGQQVTVECQIQPLRTIQLEDSIREASSVLHLGVGIIAPEDTVALGKANFTPDGQGVNQGVNGEPRSAENTGGNGGNYVKDEHEMKATGKKLGAEGGAGVVAGNSGRDALMVPSVRAMP
ncbi:hypothetical protein DFH06DRAFT_1125178 [Mycena polygramma]|nr:hypothetical protein DFH06DRAFT_1125178 [Mycena polygramma]